MKKVLLLSHGQTSVERGFSINKNLIAPNMKKHSVKAQRVIVDHIAGVGGIKNVCVSKLLLQSCRGARMKYHEYLEKEKQNKKT